MQNSLSNLNTEMSPRKGISSTQTTSSHGSKGQGSRCPTLEREVASQEGLDAYISWRAAYPIGVLLDRRIERNSQAKYPSALHDMHKEEQAHIAKPIDYYCTKPDDQIRWKV